MYIGRILSPDYSVLAQTQTQTHGACIITAHQATVSDGFFSALQVTLLAVNVTKKHTRYKYVALYGYETVARRAIILQAPVWMYAFFCQREHTESLLCYGIFSNYSASARIIPIKYAALYGYETVARRAIILQAPVCV